MWSGPRNISTALMRAWGSRDDTVVCDEPLYAHYLQATSIPHPGRDEILAHHDADWRRVVRTLTGDIPHGKAVFYQKHMAHHLLPEMDRAWLRNLTHAFLIRDPRKMLTSLIRMTPEPRLEDTGLPQQWEIFQFVQREFGTIPPVVDARDVLTTPRDLLHGLCSALNVPFQEAMLSWEPGLHPTDGIWAKYWYTRVKASTGFEPYRAKPDAVPAHLQPLYETCLDYYQRLHAHRLTP